jgi:hypothetical protein
MTEADSRIARADAPDGGVTRCDDCDRPLQGKQHYVFEPNGDCWVLCPDCHEASLT